MAFSTRFVTTWMMPVVVAPDDVEIVADRDLERRRRLPPDMLVSTCADELVEPHRSAPQREPAGVDAGGVEQLGDEPAEPVGVGVDGLEHQLALVVGEPVPLGEQGRGEALDAGERRPQLVRHRGDEVGPFAVALVAHARVAHAHDDALDRAARSLAHEPRRDEVLAPPRRPPRLLGDAGARGEPVVGPACRSNQELPLRSSNGSASSSACRSSRRRRRAPSPGCVR